MTEFDARHALVRLLLEHNLDVAGYAFVVWSNDGRASVAVSPETETSVPHIMLPVFVGDALSEKLGV